MPDSPVDDARDPRNTPLRSLIPAWRPTGEVVPRWEQTLPGYLRSLALGAREGTGRTYLEALARFIRTVGEPLEATPAQVETFLARPRRGRHGTQPGARSASTVVTERAALRRYYRWARREGLRADDPTADVDAPRRQPYRDVRALGAEQAGRLLGAVPTESVAGLRLKTLALWYGITGRRLSEVLGLRRGDVDLEAGTYSYEGKGGMWERRELIPELAAATERWIRHTGVPDDAQALLFPGRFGDGRPITPQVLRRQLKLVAARADLGELKRPIHTLRHTNARLRREAGASIEDVQAALDHSSLATTALYLRKLEGSSDPHGARVAALLTGATAHRDGEPDEGQATSAERAAAQARNGVRTGTNSSPATVSA